MTQPVKKNTTARTLAKAMLGSQVPCYLLDRNGVLQFANSSLVRLLNANLEDLVGLDCSSPLVSDATIVEAGKLPLASLLSCPLPPSGARIETSTIEIPVAKSSDSKEEQGGSTSWERVAITLHTAHRSERLCFLMPRANGLADTSNHEVTFGQSSHVAIQRIRKRYANLDDLHSLMGQSGWASRAMQQAQSAIAGSCSLTIVGPAGSGKSQVARAVFMGRIRRQGLDPRLAQLFPVECRLMDAVLLSNMIEVVDASAQRGSHARSQVLLLERIDELPLEAHSVLLTYLSRPSVPCVIATTQVPLQDCFRGDAVWNQIVGRIDIQSISLCALTQRPEDIPVLVHSLLQRRCSEKKMADIPSVEPQAMELLQSYVWPRNVEELDAALSQSLKANPVRVEAAHLPVAIQTAASHVESKALSQQPIDLDAVLLDVEKTILMGMLGRTKGNRALAARLLGISRPRLLRRLEQLGVNESDSGSEAKADQGKKSEQAPTITQAKDGDKEPKASIASQTQDIEEPIEFMEIDFREAEDEE
ncbi:MAG: helix-turn-helix domain-containing protein [Pirellulales bacterium]